MSRWDIGEGDVLGDCFLTFPDLVGLCRAGRVLDGVWTNCHGQTN